MALFGSLLPAGYTAGAFDSEFGAVQTVYDKDGNTKYLVRGDSTTVGTKTKGTLKFSADTLNQGTRVAIGTERVMTSSGTGGRGAPATFETRTSYGRLFDSNPLAGASYTPGSGGGFLKQYEGLAILAGAGLAGAAVGALVGGGGAAAASGSVGSGAAGASSGASAAAAATGATGAAAASAPATGGGILSQIGSVVSGVTGGSSSGFLGTLSKVGSVVSGLTDAYSAYQQYQIGQDVSNLVDQQAAEYRRQADIQSRMADIQNMRSRREQLRQVRRARAAIVSAGANNGTSGSSGVLGGAGSVVSQGAANLGYFNSLASGQRQMYESQTRVGGLQQQIGGLQGDASMWGTVGNLAGRAFQATGGWNTIFGGNEAAANVANILSKF